MTKTRHGITLLELLVVVAIVILLLAITLPAVEHLRESARRIQCSSNLKQIGVALHNYHATHGALPFGLQSPADPPGFTAYSAHSMLLPFLEQNEVYSSLNFSLSALYYVNVPGAMANTTALRYRVAAFFCPSDTRPFRFEFPDWHPFFGVEPAPNNYVACMGDGLHPVVHPRLLSPNGLFFNSSSVRLGEVVDGASHTAAFSETITGTGGDPMYLAVDIKRDTHRSPTRLLVTSRDQFQRECATVTPEEVARTRTLERGNSWLEGAPFRTLYNHVVAPNPGHPDCGLEGDIWLGGVFAARSLHSGGVNLLLADGSTRFVTNEVDLNVWRSLATRNGGESIAASDF